MFYICCYKYVKLKLYNMKTGYYWFKKDIATSVKKRVAECLQQWYIGFYNEDYPNQLFYGAYVFSFDDIDEIDYKQIIR